MSRLLEGSIADKSSDERKEIFRSVIEDLFLPQRRLLLEFREHTQQGALVEDGPFSEMLASIVSGVPGYGRRGNERRDEPGDLSDATEVKRAYRIDPNIDFVLEGRVQGNGASRHLIVNSPPLALLDEGVLTQANANASSIQLLRRQDHALYPVPDCLARTKAKDAIEPDSDGLSVCFGQAAPGWVQDGLSGYFALRQERQHINFNKKTREELSLILKRRPILVFYSYDLLGRLQIAVVRCVLSKQQLTSYLNRVYSGRSPESRAQAQPYLFADNRREQIVSEGIHSVVALGGRLLAVGVEMQEGFTVTYWDPKGRRPVAKEARQLTAAHVGGGPLPLNTIYDRINLAGTRGRQEAAGRFFTEGIADWIDGLAPYCLLTTTTRNIGLSSRAQHLVSSLTGLRGTRSSARGADLVEECGSPSDVKLSTGQPGDAFGTVGNPPLTLGENAEKMGQWRRLFAVRLVDQKDGRGPRVLVHAPTPKTMREFRSQLDSFFQGRKPNGGGGLQYAPGRPFPSDSYGGEKRKLEFVRVADLQRGREKRFPNPVPES